MQKQEIFQESKYGTPYDAATHRPIYSVGTPRPGRDTMWCYIHLVMHNELAQYVGPVVLTTSVVKQPCQQAGWDKINTTYNWEQRGHS